MPSLPVSCQPSSLYTTLACNRRSMKNSLTGQADLCLNCLEDKALYNASEASALPAFPLGLGAVMHNWKACSLHNKHASFSILLFPPKLRKTYKVFPCLPLILTTTLKGRLDSEMAWGHPGIFLQAVCITDVHCNCGMCNRPCALQVCNRLVVFAAGSCITDVLYICDAYSRPPLIGLFSHQKKHKSKRSMWRMLRSIVLWKWTFAIWFLLYISGGTVVLLGSLALLSYENGNVQKQ